MIIFLYLNSSVPEFLLSRSKAGDIYEGIKGSKGFSKNA